MKEANLTPDMWSWHSGKGKTMVTVKRSVVAEVDGDEGGINK